MIASRMLWNEQPKRVTAPYVKVTQTLENVPEYHRARGIRWESGRTILPRLNTTQLPIVNKYREGKVKSTPVRGVK